MAEEYSEKKNYAYAKRPLWQWIVIYLVIAVVVYGAIYYFFLAKKGNYVMPKNRSATPTTAQSSQAQSGNIYMTRIDPSKGNYLTDFSGRTLYTSSQDKSGVSNCTGGCVSTWPPYSSGAMAQGQFPAGITVIVRSDGSKQFAWNGMPLYYFASDSTPGQLNGDGLGTFRVARP